MANEQKPPKKLTPEELAAKKALIERLAAGLAKK